MPVRIIVDGTPVPYHEPIGHELVATVRGAIEDVKYVNCDGHISVIHRSPDREAVAPLLTNERRYETTSPDKAASQPLSIVFVRVRLGSQSIIHVAVPLSMI